MKRYVFFIFVIGLALVMPLNYALSKDHEKTNNPKPDYSGHFGDMDTDGNDFVSWEEFKAHFPHAEKRVFSEADGDGGGGIDHDEWHEFKDKHDYGHRDKH